MLHGGDRDGETTEVAAGVRRLLAASEAPGLLDVYEATGDLERVRGNDGPALVFAFVGQESAAGVAPELLHAPPKR